MTMMPTPPEPAADAAGATPELVRGEYRLSTDIACFDVDAIHAALASSYWSPGIPRDVVERALRHSLGFGLFHRDAQIGLARVVTDRATFAYLSDVYILEAHRGRGLARWMLEVILGHPALQGLRRFMLATADAHGLYARFGFRPLAAPARMMEVLRPDAYAPAARVLRDDGDEHRTSSP